MKGSAWKRARGFRRVPFELAPVYVVGIASAFVAPLFVLLIGFLVHLKVERVGNTPPREWSLGPLLDGRLLGLPWSENAETLVLMLLGVGVALAVLESNAQLAYWRAAERAAVAI